MIIDSHVHLWNPARGDYGWMPKGDPVLDRPYRPADLGPILDRHGVSRVVLVQAAPTVEETDYMLGLADGWGGGAAPGAERVAGVVGWVDFEDPSHRRHLERFAAHPKVVGVRPMIQDIPDLGWMHRREIVWAFDAMAELGLVFDALGYPVHLPGFLELFQRHPGLTIVVDHGAKPRIRDVKADPGAFTRWAADIGRIARETPAVCKLSGLATEAAAGFSDDELAPFAAHILDVFGPERVMFGSDWPVVTLAASYERWFAAARRFVPEAARAAVFAGTAQRVYGL